MEKQTVEFHSGGAAANFANKVNGKMVAKSLSGSKKKFIVTFTKQSDKVGPEVKKLLSPKEQVFTRNKLKIALEVSREFGFIPKEIELVNVKKHMEGFLNKPYKSQDLYNVLREYEDREYNEILEIVAEVYINNI